MAPRARRIPARARPARVAVTWRGARAWVSDARLRRAARAALAQGGREGIALALVFVGDRELARMHARWLGDPAPTDVIAFDLGAGPGPVGEVYVSWQCARRTARERGVDPARELCLYVAHGVLHLCGMRDATPRGRASMRAAERRVLRALGFPDDRAPHDEIPRARRAGS